MKTKFLKYLDKYTSGVAYLFDCAIGMVFTKDLIYVVETRKGFTESKITKYKAYRTEERDVSDVIQEINRDFQFKGKSISISLHDLMAQFKVVSIPEMSEGEIRPWINENPAIFNMSSAVESNLNFDYVHLPIEQKILIGVVHNSEIFNLKHLIEKYERNVIKVTPGFSELIHLIPRDQRILSKITIKNDDTVEFILSQDGNLLYYNQLPVEIMNGGRIEDMFNGDLKSIGEALNENAVSYTDEELYIHSEWELEREYLPTLSQSIGALKNGNNTLNFMYPGNDAGFWQKFFQKHTLIMGGLLLSFYLVAILFSILSESFAGELEKRKEDSESRIAEIKNLQVVSNKWQGRLDNARKIRALKSNTNLLLQAVSFHIPDKCWLTSFEYERDTDKTYNTILKGMAEKETAIHTFLSNLEGDQIFRKIKLDYISEISRDEMRREWKISVGNLSSFQISLLY